MRKTTDKDDLAVLFAILGLGYVAILPISHTIALRNALMVLLLGAGFWYVLKRGRFSWGHFLSYVPLAVLGWAAYLLVFPFFSSETSIALKSFSSQWGKGLLAMVAGVLLAAKLATHRFGSVFALALASFVPVGLYLVMFCFKAIQSASLPLGYVGVELSHGVLSYAAAQAAILLTVAGITSLGRQRTVAVFLLLLTILSMVLVRSRGGLAFAILAVALVLTASFRKADPQRRRLIAVSFVTLVAIGVVSVTLAISTDVRWQGAMNRLSAGLLGDALQVHCEGIASIETEIERRFGVGDEAERVKYSIHDGDGARVVVLRSGLMLLSEHPWGLDGSRGAFRKRLLDVCPNPSANIAHSHNGWIDTALAIGVPGAILYLLVLVSFIRIGFRFADARPTSYPWALVLVSSAALWIIRAMFDSCFQDHMLEMQGFFLAYAATAVLRREETS